MSFIAQSFSQNTAARRQAWGRAQGQVRKAPDRVAGYLRVYDVHGAARLLTPPIAKGGEGVIHLLDSDREVVVKVYRQSDSKRGKTQRDQRRKLEAMLNRREFIEDPRFAWPRLLVFDSRRRWIGYAMRRVEGVAMYTLCQPRLIRERLPSWTRAHIIACGFHFIDLVRKCHRHGVLIGDINPNNFLIDPTTCEVRAVDCDSFQCRSDTRTFPCPVGIPMLLAPELLGADLHRTLRTVEQELFSVAIMLFRMFMLGLYPFSGKNSRNPVADLRAGNTVLGPNCRDIMPAGPWYGIWSHLPPYLKSLFVRSFRDGHSDPAARVRLDEWADALRRYADDLKQGRYNAALIPKCVKPSNFLEWIIRILKIPAAGRENFACTVRKNRDAAPFNEMKAKVASQTARSKASTNLKRTRP